MSSQGISWTNTTWNPIVGCSKVSAGCDHCWAERMARLHYHKYFPNGWTGEVELFTERLGWPNHKRKPIRIAVGLMGDLFHDAVPFDFLDLLWATMGCCEAPDLRHLTFQILTKRPKRMLEYARHRAESGMVFDLPNLWVGVSCENQAAADERIPLLLQTPAAVRFVSCEPLLGSINLTDLPVPGNDRGFSFNALTDIDDEHFYNVHAKLDWVICGGESGPGARPMHPEWIRSLRDQCQAVCVPFHFKQWGEWSEVVWIDRNIKPVLNISVPTQNAIGKNTKEMIWSGFAPCNMRRVGKKAAGRLLDGREWLEFPEAKA